MDVMEARTDQTLDLTVQWRLSNWTKSHNEREIFTKVTIQMVGEEENKVDIWIMEDSWSSLALKAETGLDL